MTKKSEILAESKTVLTYTQTMDYGRLHRSDHARQEDLVWDSHSASVTETRNLRTRGPMGAWKDRHCCVQSISPARLCYLQREQGTPNTPPLVLGGGPCNHGCRLFDCAVLEVLCPGAKGWWARSHDVNGKKQGGHDHLGTSHERCLY